MFNTVGSTEYSIMNKLDMGQSMFIIHQSRKTINFLMNKSSQLLAYLNFFFRFSLSSTLSLIFSLIHTHTAF